MIRLAPGLALAGAGVAVSLGAHEALPALPPLVLCVALGILVANVAHVPAANRRNSCARATAARSWAMIEPVSA